MTSSETPLRETARAVMQQRWGYPDFRPGQAEVISAVLEGDDVLAILPTGGGKSMCYQVPALMQDGLTLVISPLIALMHDQVAGLRARGIAAAFIDSTLSTHEVDQRWTNAEFGQYDVLYIAPERLSSELFVARAERLDVGLLAVDEAHCVSEWGHHFRPAYMEIAQARELLGAPPTLAVTATATPAVRRDIMEQLQLRDPTTIVRGFDRPNIIWSVFQTENKRAKVNDVLDAVAGSGIVYAATRRSVEAWADRLDARGVATVRYHGGMRAEAREAAQQAWIEGTARVIVATNAFGMGIDKPDVRFVLHVEPPASLEAYYQEAGRAGRDGKKAYAVLLYHPSDAETQQALIDASHPTGAEVQQVYDAVCNVGQVPIAAQPDDPVAVNMEAVRRMTGCARGKIRTAIELLERQGAWQVLPRWRHFGMIRFEQSADATRRYADRQRNRALGGFIRSLLRIVHAEAFRTWWRVDLRMMERRLSMPRDRLLRGMTFLAEQGLIRWRPPGEALHLELLVPRAQKYPVDDRTVRQARRQAETRLDHLLRYIRSTACRRHFLLTYFGEAHPPACGACDVCLKRHTPPPITPDDEPLLRAVLRAVADEPARARWFDERPAPPHRLDALIGWLERHEYLHLDDPLEEAFSVTEKGQALLERWAA